jgi:hypothetical protein
VLGQGINEEYEKNVGGRGVCPADLKPTREYFLTIIPVIFITG